MGGRGLRYTVHLARDLGYGYTLHFVDALGLQYTFFIGVPLLRIRVVSDGEAECRILRNFYPEGGLQ
jgi:hypothetical protein